MIPYPSPALGHDQNGPGRRIVAIQRDQIIDPAELAPTRWEVIGLGALSAVFAVLYAFGGYQVVNWSGPLLLGVVVGAGMWNSIRLHPAAIWSPMFALRLATLSFFALGAILPLFFDPTTLDYALALYSYSDQEAAKVFLVWLVSTFFTLAGAQMSSTVLVKQRVAFSDYSATAMLWIGLAFYTIGVGSFLLLELPQTLGSTAIVLPGFVLTLFQAMNAVGLFLIAHWTFEKRQGGAYLMLGILFAFNVVIGLIVLSKAVIMLPQLLISLAYLMHRVSIQRALVVAGGLVASLAILQPIVAHARDLQTQQYGGLVGGTVGERLGYAATWFEDTDTSQAADEINPISRLAYAPAASYVVSRYDNNQPSDTISNAFVSIIPRVLWPDKPATTSVGIELYYELTGHDTSSLGTTVPADVYWNYGWWGILFIFPLTGAAIMVATYRCFAIVTAREWIMMPFVLMCFRTAYGIDGQFVNTIFAPGVMAIAAYVMIRVAIAIWPARTSGNAVHG